MVYFIHINNGFLFIFIYRRNVLLIILMDYLTINDINYGLLERFNIINCIELYVFNLFIIIIIEIIINSLNINHFHRLVLI